MAVSIKAGVTGKVCSAVPRLEAAGVEGLAHGQVFLIAMNAVSNAPDAHNSDNVARNSVRHRRVRCRHTSPAATATEATARQSSTRRLAASCGE